MSYLLSNRNRIGSIFSSFLLLKATLYIYFRLWLTIGSELTHIISKCGCFSCFIWWWFNTQLSMSRFTSWNCTLEVLYWINSTIAFIITCVFFKLVYSCLQIWIIWLEILTFLQKFFCLISGRSRGIHRILKIFKQILRQISISSLQSIF